MTEYELTRRDALAALGAAGVGAAGLGALTLADDGSPDGEGGNEKRDDGEQPLGRREVEVVRAVARVVYPNEVSGVEGFVERYVVGRARDRPAHARGIADAVAALEEYARDWYDREFLEMDADGQDDVLREMGVPVADPDPEGSAVERVRFYLVNELLYALYTTPTGGELVGLENPQGHPGGTDSYQRGP
ncbi:MAG: gluconate 2-dehydrogenase subunit 3 family protein [Halobacteriales archaeon]